MKANELMIGDWVNYDPNVFIEDEYIETQPLQHELQHALRLCGLNELADNFKITDK